MTSVIAAIMMFLFLPVGKQTLTTNEHAVIEIKSPDTLRVSETKNLLFIFLPMEGIHINTTPLFELRLEKKSLFEVVGNPAFQKNDKDYLDITKPVEFSIKAKKGTSYGKKILKGKLNYFYCSDKDGWCNRFTQPIEMTIEIPQ